MMSGRNGEPSVVVVGGGPAGMAAATTMVEHGIAVTMVDESPGLGGQYYKQFNAAPHVRRGHEIDQLQREGIQKAAALAGAQVTRLTNTLVWGVFDRQLALCRDDRVDIIQPDAVVIASGAIERLAAFPGWTLPGVMTAGGAQTLVGREAILPGKRFLLAGTGPLLLAIALEIAEAGGEVVAVVEGSRFTAPGRYVRHFIRQTKRIRQMGEYQWSLRRRKIPILYGRAVVSACGNGHIREAAIAKIDNNWHVKPGTETRCQIDTLCLHYGFTASTELARLAGCEIVYEPARGGWYVAHDAAMRATQLGVYVAGQNAGIGGADLAEATGHLAGLTVAKDLGFLDDRPYQRLAAETRREVDAGLSFAEMLNRVFTPGHRLAEMVTPTTTICRCEEVMASEVDRVLAQGARSLNDVKRHTRCGMGFCQGRICSQVLMSYIAGKTEMPLIDIGQFRARPPIKPVSLRALASIPAPDATSDRALVEARGELGGLRDGT